MIILYLILIISFFSFCACIPFIIADIKYKKEIQKTELGDIT